MRKLKSHIQKIIHVTFGTSLTFRGKLRLPLKVRVFCGQKVLPDDISQK